MKTRLGQSVLLASSLLVASCVGNNFDNQKLIVGLECDYAPFNWTVTTASAYSLPIDGIAGQYADGYDIQIAKHLALEMGKEVVIKKIEWGALIPALQTGDINAIIAGMSYTEERDVSIDFSGAYYVSDLVAVVRGDSDLVGIDSIQDLSGYKVVTQLGTIQDSVIDQIDGVIHQPGTDTFNTAALSVIAGDSDAMIAEYPVARAIVNANPTLAIVEFEVGFTGIDENELSVSVAVADGNSELLGLINDGLSSLTEDMRQAMMDGAISRSGV
ncbi:MAG: transporter substrate-binding domain-containing protein [Bacilli bacterium]|nr:transporter substrate-binding domain-containing protein [Bacilli bacterium]